MRRFSVCLLFLLLAPAFTASWAARRADSSSADKGSVENTCVSEPDGNTNPYSNLRFSLAQLTATTASGTTYVATVNVYAWGQYDCPSYTGSPTSGQNPVSEESILQISISASPSTSYKLVSFRLNNTLPSQGAPAFLACGNSGITPCENTAEQNSQTFEPIVPEPAPIAGADGTATLWTFGDIYQGGVLQELNPSPSSAAVVLFPGCPASSSQNCIGIGGDTKNYANDLTQSTSYTITIEDASGQVVLGSPSSITPISGAGHDVFSSTSYHPVTIPTGVYLSQIFDLSANYPQQDDLGNPTLNGQQESAYPPPCTGGVANCPGSDTSFHAIWFDFSPQNNTQVSVSTANSHFDTILSVFTGSAGGLQSVPTGFDDDNPNATIGQNQLSSAVTFQAQEGVTYHIQASEYPPYDTGSVPYISPLSTDPILYLTLTTPQLTPSPATLASFGSEMIGSTTAAQQVTLTAQYSAPSGITLGNVSISGDFQIASKTCGSSLNDGTTCTLSIVFTPTGAGLRTGTLTITSSAENSPLTFALSGTGVAPPLAITTTILNVAYIGSSYSGMLQATGGIPPYDWTVVSGSLPTNLTLQTTGVISGTPTQSGTSSFTVQVSDSESPAATTTAQLTLSVEQPGASRFVPVAPCRIADTRNPTGPFGGPAIAAMETRSFPIPQSACGIPSTATAYALNVTVVPEGPLNFLTVWPAGQAQPTVSLLNSTDGRIKANAAIIPAGVSGAISVYPYAETPTHVVIDISGYFIPATASGLAFYPLTPCRIADTRNADGPFGGPSLIGGQSRAFSIQASDCKVPASATAYSLNITAIPAGPLNYLTLWPTGQAQPTVSTLNADTGTVTANAAIVPAGNGGQVSFFVTNDSDLVVDINGYFASPAPGGTSLYTTTPCRVLDTREFPASPFPGTYTIGVLSSGCTLPASASAYVLNATVVPEQPLGYLSLWPAGESQPLVSTLNAIDGSITSNMAIVPTNNGSIDAYATNDTQLILDISSFFAP